MNALAESGMNCSEYAEVDPSGRYGRYNEILGKGASKTVYRAFDEYQGIEVAWNQVKLHVFQKTPEDLERLYCEIHLLKTLKHENIMKFYTSWVDTTNRKINFVTEMFTSGTLRQYRLKHKRVNIRALKHWCRQILKGLLYLHNHDPPVIHRDLKCDNIFVNGNQGEVKIGDLGLAAILRNSHAACCVGTPEFMAPEVYKEEYNELVDIYSFGMCILEMVTFEYPYSECSHPAQIYKKVISGQKPEALYRVQDPEVRQFVEKCLATVSARLSARELLKHPFLQVRDCGTFLRPSDYNDVGPLIREPLYGILHANNSLINGYVYDHGWKHELDYDRRWIGTAEMDFLSCQGGEHSADVDITIKGRRRDDDGVFLRLRIADEGLVRNIYFPFDLETDTALSVATEMVAELEITDQDVIKIADMIDGEITTLVPEWKRGAGIEETPECTVASFCRNCASNGSLLDYVSCNYPGGDTLHVLQCSSQGCAAIHGRFEEITYQVEGSEPCPKETSSEVPCQSNGIHYADIWAQREGLDSSSIKPEGSDCDKSEVKFESDVKFDQRSCEKEDDTIHLDYWKESDTLISSSSNPPASVALCDNHENEIRQELRWLKAKYQMQLRELRDQQLGAKTKSLIIQSDSKDSKRGYAASISSPSPPSRKRGNKLSGRPNFTSSSPTDTDKKDADTASNIIPNCVKISGSCNPEHMAAAKSYYSGALLPQSLHRATSLPVDAVDV